MLETAPTLGSVETSTRQKKQFARQSLEYNVRDPVFKKLFPEYVERYEEEQASRQTNGEGGTTVTSSDSLAIRNDRIEMNGLMAYAAGLVAILSIVMAMRFI